MIRRPPRSTRSYTLFPARRSSDLDMNQTQKVQVAAIAAHEGAPGHHFQIARQQELTGIPKFRKFGGYGAYIEGWGLYSERLANKMGLYQTPYDRFGMLSLKLWGEIGRAACRERVWKYV